MKKNWNDFNWVRALLTGSKVRAQMTFVRWNANQNVYSLKIQDSIPKCQSTFFLLLTTIFFARPFSQTSACHTTIFRSKGLVKIHPVQKKWTKFQLKFIAWIFAHIFFKRSQRVKWRPINRYIQHASDSISWKRLMRTSEHLFYLSYCFHHIWNVVHQSLSIYLLFPLFKVSFKWISGFQCGSLGSGKRSNTKKKTRSIATATAMGKNSHFSHEKSHLWIRLQMETNIYRFERI